MSSMSDFFSDMEKKNDEDNVDETNDNDDKDKPIEKENDKGSSFDMPNVGDVFGHVERALFVQIVAEASWTISYRGSVGHGRPWRGRWRDRRW